MKPWQTLLHKAPGKAPGIGGKKEGKKRTQVQARSAKTPKSHKGAKEQIMFQSSHQLQEAYQTTKGKGNLKTVSLEESSLEMIAHLKIETTYALTQILTNLTYGHWKNKLVIVGMKGS